MNKYNAEGYYDPTAYEALSAVEQSEKSTNSYRPLVYICSSYSGDIDANTRAARYYSRLTVDRGYIPIAPRLLFTQFLDDSDPGDREFGLFLGNVFISK